MATSTAQARRDYAGPSLFCYGFRPFFLGGAIWAALAVPFWLAQYAGYGMARSAIDPLYWHIHEMLYGYVAAIVAGFLLTAIPNWTGRLPVRGLPLAALAGLWLAGRVAMLATSWIGLSLAAIVDIAFLVVLSAVAMREIVAGENWRNLRVLVIVAIMILGNVVFHIEIQEKGAADYGMRLGFAAVILLISLIGGRVIPSFTRNWLVRINPGRLPQPFGRFDAITLVLSAMVFLVWVIAPDWSTGGLLLMAAGLLHVVRLSRWAGDRTFADRLVLVLHVAYAFVPLGFLLMGASVFWNLFALQSAGFHAWSAGAIGMMTLAVMTRASLGHTGQPLVASAMTQAIYGCAALAALLRIAASFSGDLTLMWLSLLFWVLAFGGFALVYGPLLAGRRPVWSRPA